MNSESTHEFLKVDKLTLQFKQGKEKHSHVVLDKLSLEIGMGEFVCVLGPSGCGKTSLLNCIAGFQQPMSGTIMVDGKPVSGPSKERGVMFQEYGLFPWFTVEQNISFGPIVNGYSKREALTIAHDFIEMIGLKGFEKHYPGKLSGGMKQRVSLARALANSPKFLLMDEPFAALDEQTRYQMQEELLKIWQKQKITCLFITHSISEAIYLSDRVIVMKSNPGRIVLDMNIELPRLRDRGDERMFVYQNQISKVLKEEVA